MSRGFIKRAPVDAEDQTVVVADRGSALPGTPASWKREASMSARGSLSTFGVAELLQITALFRKTGCLRLEFLSGRSIVVFVQGSSLSGLEDSGRVWQLGDLLGSLGRLQEADKRRLLAEAKERGTRFGQLLLEKGYLTRQEMELLLRRLILQSLLYAVENETQGEFEFQLGTVYRTTVTFPITDYLIEITSCIDEVHRLRRLLGPGGGAVAVDPDFDLASTLHALQYRQVQVVAQVDGEKTPMEVTAAVGLAPTETLRILSELARSGVVTWAPWTGRRVRFPPWPCPCRCPQRRSRPPTRVCSRSLEKTGSATLQPGQPWLAVETQSAAAGGGQRHSWAGRACGSDSTHGPSIGAGSGRTPAIFCASTSMPPMISTSLCSARTTTRRWFRPGHSPSSPPT